MKKFLGNWAVCCFVLAVASPVLILLFGQIADGGGLFFLLLGVVALIPAAFITMGIHFEERLNAQEEKLAYLTALLEQRDKESSDHS